MVRQVLSPGPTRLILIGPPGAGKSTVAPALIARFDLVRIATGDRLRAEIAAGTGLGRAAAVFVERGALVPDGLMDRVLHACLEDVPAARGFLLDGYPRSVQQAVTLDAMLRETGVALTAVLVLDLPDAEVLHRLGGRRLCRGGGDPWPLHLDDAEAVARCRAQGGHLVQRDDDRPDVIARRLEIYRAESAPLLAHYRQAGLVRTIDATGTRGATASACRRTS
jgi:adenylate kinase